MKKILIVLIAYCFIPLRTQVFNTGSFKNKIFVLDGFGLELTVYNRNAEPEKKLSLKNITKNAVFDFIIHFDDFNTYLTDSNRDMIYLLDENFTLKRSIDIRKEHNIELYRKIFPSQYNELIIASKSKDQVFMLRNNRLKKIISSELEFDDIFADRDFIYLLYKEGISVYSFSGLYLKKIAVPNNTDYSDFIVNDSRIYLKSKSAITSVNRRIREFSVREIIDNAAFTAIDSTLYYISEDSLKLIRIDL